MGPDYFSTDMRVTRNVRCGQHATLNFIAESFNLFNRTNTRVQISDDGFYNAAGQFVAYSHHGGRNEISGEFLMNSQFLTADQCLCTTAGAVCCKAQLLIRMIAVYI